MAKLLVIDKCSFQGMAHARLLDSVRNYCAVLPYALGIECLMSDDCNGKKPCKNPITLMQRLDLAVKGGGYFGRSSALMLREEREMRCPIGHVVDEGATEGIRNGMLTVTADFVSQEAHICRSTFQLLLESLGELGQAYLANIKRKGLSCGFQREIQETGKVERFAKWLRVAEEMRSVILGRWIPDLAPVISEEWYTWQVVRLWWAWATEWAGRRAHTGIPVPTPDLSNDLYDMEYVAYLSRADGLLTGDARLVEPLARAAFPEKDVFSSLEEVPESYRCDWTGG